ncbi:MAG: hypothetical protein R3C26_07015 [Calditrichia bacterium]
MQTDSFTVSGTDTTWFAEEDETYSYNITVRNTGTLTAATYCCGIFCRTR